MVSAMLTPVRNFDRSVPNGNPHNFAASVKEYSRAPMAGQHLTATGYQVRVFCSRAEALDVPQIVHVHVVTACLNA